MDRWVVSGAVLTWWWFMCRSHSSVMCSICTVYIVYISSVILSYSCSCCSDKVSEIINVLSWRVDIIQSSYTYHLFFDTSYKIHLQCIVYFIYYITCHLSQVCVSVKKSGVDHVTRFCNVSSQKRSVTVYCLIRVLIIYQLISLRCVHVL